MTSELVTLLKIGLHHSCLATNFAKTTASIGSSQKDEFFYSQNVPSL